MTVAVSSQSPSPPRGLHCCLRGSSWTSSPPSHWPFEEWGRFLPEHSTAVSLLDRLLHHNNVVATDGES